MSIWGGGGEGKAISVCILRGLLELQGGANLIKGAAPLNEPLLGLAHFQATKAFRTAAA